MKSKTSVIFLIIVLLVVALVITYLTRAHAPMIKQCPDEWIEDRMPTTEGDNFERQYLVFRGERKEIKDYDLDWIKSNCSVQVQYVY